MARERLLGLAVDLHEIIDSEFKAIVSRGPESDFHRRSYVHNNGFQKLFLAEVSTGRLVAHLWDEPRLEAPDDYLLAYDVHNHRWPFASYLASGSLIMEHFRDTTEDGSTFNRYSYSSPELGESAPLDYHGEAYLLREFQAQIFSGTIFSLDNFRLHRVYPPRGGRSISIVLQAPAITTTTDIFVDPSIVKGPSVPVRRLTMHEIHSAFQRLESLSL